MKDKILELLRSTNRDGIEDVISFLEKSDFLLHRQALDFMEIMKED